MSKIQKDMLKSSSWLSQSGRMLKVEEADMTDCGYVSLKKKGEMPVSSNYVCVGAQFAGWHPPLEPSATEQAPRLGVNELYIEIMLRMLCPSQASEGCWGGCVWSHVMVHVSFTLEDKHKCVTEKTNWEWHNFKSLDPILSHFQREESGFIIQFSSKLFFV